MNAPVRVFPFSPSYGVTKDGRVQRLDTGRWRKPSVQKRGGYLAVSLWENGKETKWPIHQIVCITFRGPRPSPDHDAAHDDGNKLNNHWTNVLWKTKVENESDKIKHGTSNRGERNGCAKLSDAQVAEIKAAPRYRGYQPFLAKLYGVDQSQISNIVRGKRRSMEHQQ